MNVVSYSSKPCQGRPVYVPQQYYHVTSQGDRKHQSQINGATYYVHPPAHMAPYQTYGGVPTYVYVPEPQLVYGASYHPQRKFSSSSRSYGSRKSSSSSQGYHSCYDSPSTRNSSSSDSDGSLKLRRSNSGDSGIATSSAFGSDDDSDVIKTPEITKALEAIEEPLWTIEQDRQYWQAENRSPPSYGSCFHIVKQLEFYLCDEYLAKDKYLLRQVRCKKGGYVSIKLLASFKKMKKLAQDWESLRSAIVRKSTKLVISEEGFRLRRIVSLSDELMKPRMLTSILAIRLSENFNSVDKVTSLFRIFGDIGLVRILRPGKSIPTDLRNYATQVPDIGSSLCAVVDFDTADSAMAAVRVIKGRNSTEDENDTQDPNQEEYLKKLNNLPNLEDLRLALLGPRVRRTLYRQDREKSEQTENDKNETKNITPQKSPSKRNPIIPTNVLRMPHGPSTDSTKHWIRKC